MFTDTMHVSEYCERLKYDLQLSEKQSIISANRFNIDNKDFSAAGTISMLAVILFLMLTGYLLIYNVLNISVSHDVCFYGLLKTLGATSRQIRRVVTGQILRLSAVGVPLGLVATFLLSSVTVPILITNLNAISTDAVVSFSPLIYVGAAMFALFTAFLGALKPAIKAARVSPIEAQKFVGENYKTNHQYKPSRGKPYKMAARNIFRDRKRAITVLCSLFFGISTFVVVTTFVFSMDMEYYINAMYTSDFTLENDTLSGFIIKDGEMIPANPIKDTLDSELISQIKALPGVESLSTMADGWAKNANGGSFLKIVGVDSESIHKAKAAFDKSIDLAAFERGEFALVSENAQDLLAQSSNLTLSPFSLVHLKQMPEVTMPLGGFAPEDLVNTSDAIFPTVVVSNSLMHTLFGEIYLSEMKLDVSEEYNQQSFESLKDLVRNREISLVSKMEALKEFQNGKITMLINDYFKEPNLMLA